MYMSTTLFCRWIQKSFFMRDTFQHSLRSSIEQVSSDCFNTLIRSWRRSFFVIDSLRTLWRYIYRLAFMMIAHLLNSTFDLISFAISLIKITLSILRSSKRNQSRHDELKTSSRETCLRSEIRLRKTGSDIKR